MSGREFDLIRDHFRARVAAASDLPVGIGDDGAVLRPPAGELVWAIDTVNEGRHFPAGAPGAEVGHRALAVNLSDMVAMGARARWALLSLTLPDAPDDQWVSDFADGFLALAERAGVVLAGGDMTGGATAATVTLLGPLCETPVTRGGARPGDRVLVSGTLGDARAGLPLALGERPVAGADAEWLLERYRHPRPRLALAPLLGRYATAAIDVSDGLCADLGHVLAASGVGAEIALEKLPVSAALSRHADASARALALEGGDDYEILCTVPPAEVDRFRAEAEAAGVRMTAIGDVRKAAGLTVRGPDGESLPLPDGFSHFGDDDA